jgi:hypothetical protein
MGLPFGGLSFFVAETAGAVKNWGCDLRVLPDQTALRTLLVCLPDFSRNA